MPDPFLLPPVLAAAIAHIRAAGSLALVQTDVRNSMYEH